MRGVDGAFEKVRETIELLKRLGVKDLGIAFTATDDNVGELLSVLTLAKQMKVQFTFNGVAHNSSLYFGGTNRPLSNLPVLKRQTDRLTMEHLRSIYPRDWFRAYADNGSYLFASRMERKTECLAGTAFFFMTPDGNVFPCPILPEKLGNVEEESFRDIWTSACAASFRARIRDISNCQSHCWMLCTVYPYMRANKLSCLRWVLPNKLRAHLNMRVSSIN